MFSKLLRTSHAQSCPSTHGQTNIKELSVRHHDYDRHAARRKDISRGSQFFLCGIDSIINKRYYLDMKKSFLIFFSAFLFYSIFAQEALKSTEEEYYDFLSLQGLVERPTLGYRTLSDSEWKFAIDEDGNSLKDSEDNIWKENNLGTKRTLWKSSSEIENWFTRGIERSIKLKIYGPEWFNSYNTAAPYGQNDGALWQGKGYNSSLTGGARLEGYGFEMTVKPQVSFSQNREFDYIIPNYKGNNYIDKADTYGYYGVSSIDAPQRFGNSSFFTFDFGDTELRWTWKNFTTGFGTQSIWLGPAKLNPIIHSNNAASYPKFDIGLRKTKLTMPYLGWDLGSLEARGWWGYLTESDWFDNDNTNDHNLISGLSVNYQFPILRDFTVGLNRSMLSKWEKKDTYTLFKIYNPLLSSSSSGGDDSSDQRASITFDYKLLPAGFEVYLEWARNDFSPNLDYYIRYPFHTQGWTFGSRKPVVLPWNLRGEILLEITALECSADYDRLINWYTTFYSHHMITQGYTNKGQWLGAGIGTGGNSQYIGFSVFHKKGMFTIFGQRRNPDIDYTMYIDSKNWEKSGEQATTKHNAEKNIRTLLDFGIQNTYFVTENLNTKIALIFVNEHNPLNLSKDSFSEHRYNFTFCLGAKYNF